MADAHIPPTTVSVCFIPCDVMFAHHTNTIAQKISQVVLLVIWFGHLAVKRRLDAVTYVASAPWLAFFGLDSVWTLKTGLHASGGLKNFQSGCAYPGACKKHFIWGAPVAPLY